jgi:hypothetical protein
VKTHDNLRRIAGLTLVALIAVACGASTPTLTPTPVLPTATLEPAIPPDWETHELPEQHFSIAIPPGWTKLDLDADTMESILDSAVGDNPELAQLINSQARSLVATGIKFYALDLSPEALAAGFPSNVNVFRQEMGVEVSPDFLAQTTVGYLKNLEAVQGDIATRRIDLPAGEAAQLQYRMRTTLPAGDEIDMMLAQYIVVDGEVAYIISLGGRAQDAEKNTPIFDQIARSVRILD